MKKIFNILNLSIIILCLSSFNLKDMEFVAKSSNNLSDRLSEINTLTIYPAEKPEISIDSFSTYLKKIKAKIDTVHSYTVNKAEVGQAFDCVKIATKSTFPCPKSGILGVGKLLNGDLLYLCFDPYTPFCFFVLNNETPPLRMTIDSCSSYYKFWKEYLEHGKRKIR